MRPPHSDIVLVDYFVGYRVSEYMARVCAESMQPTFNLTIMDVIGQ